jgi:hypothetical protein
VDRRRACAMPATSFLRRPVCGCLGVGPWLRPLVATPAGMCPVQLSVTRRGGYATPGDARRCCVAKSYTTLSRLFRGAAGVGCPRVVLNG